MSKRASPLTRPTPDGEAAAIIRLLEKNTASGARQSDVFEDWCALVEGFLDMLPAHGASLVETGQPAQDTPEVAELYERLRKTYRHAQYFENFNEATRI